MPLLTTETSVFLDGLKNLNLPEINQIAPSMLRDQYEAMSTIYGGAELNEIIYQDHQLHANSENNTIKIRCYTNTNAKHLIFYAHGGGWTRGSLTTHHVMCQNLCKATECDLIAIDYSLSPENIYPKALNELEFVYDNLQKFNEKNLSITIAGDSAGANLMAGLVVRLNSKQKSIPSRAVFFYPSFDLTGQSESLKEFAEGYLLTERSINYYVGNYLGKDFNKASLAEVSPLWKIDSINFPNTLIIAAECDPIRDDARKARDILQKRNLLMGYLEVPGVIHGFAQFPGLFPEALQVFEWIKANYV
jgi:acetyl esterase